MNAHVLEKNRLFPIIPHLICEKKNPNLKGTDRRQIKTKSKIQVLHVSGTVEMNTILLEGIPSISHLMMMMVGESSV